MTTAERITWVIAAAVFLPALLAGGGFLVAIGAAALVVTGYYGGRYGARVYEQRQMGAKSTRKDLNQLISGGNNDGRRKNR